MVSSSSKFSIRGTLAQAKISPTLKVNEEVNQIKQSGKTVLHMGFGQSPFPVHPMIKRGLIEAAGRSLYLPSAGLAELREKSLIYFSEKFNFNPDEFDVMVGPGSKSLIFAIQLSIEGDLLMPVPSWVSYTPQAQMLKDDVIRFQTSLCKYSGF